MKTFPSSHRHKTLPTQLVPDDVFGFIKGFLFFFFVLSVTLGYTLQLVLLLDSVAVTASLGGVNELFGQTFGDALDVTEGRLAGADGQQSDGLVDAAEWRYVYGLPPHGTGAADTSAVLAGTAVDDGVYGNLDGVLVGHDVDLCVSISMFVVYRFSSNAYAKRRTISKECATMRTAINFFPLFRPFIIKELVSRSMIGHCALRNRLTA